MTIKMSNGESIRASRIGKWFVVGFATATVALNTREIAGFFYYLV